MKTFNQFQEEMNKKVPPVTGLGGGGGGTDSITAKSSAKSFKKRVGDVAKVLTFPFHKRRKDPTEKFATEGVASLAIKGGSKLIPALMTGIGAVGTINQIKKNEKFGKQTKKGLKNIAKNIDRNKLEPDTAAEREELIAKSKPEVGKLVDKQVKSDKGMDKLLDKINSAQKPKRKYKTRNNPSGRVGIGKKDKRKIGNMEKEYYKKERKKEVKQSNRSDDMIVAKQGEAQKQNKLVDKYEKKQKSTENNLKRRNFVKKLKGDIPEEAMAAPTNNVGGGQIAGTVEAGDDPPVKKKKKKKTYAYGGRGSRKMWMSNK